jgi:hypothetical protein
MLYANLVFTKDHVNALMVSLATLALHAKKVCHFSYHIVLLYCMLTVFLRTTQATSNCKWMYCK